MGKRFIRKLSPLTFDQAMREWIGKKADIVVAEKTYHGQITHIDTLGIHIGDINRYWYNRRQHEHRFSWEQITELTITIHTGY
jgi:hypothetical protein